MTNMLEFTRQIAGELNTLRGPGWNGYTDSSFGGGSFTRLVGPDSHELRVDYFTRGDQERVEVWGRCNGSPVGKSATFAVSKGPAAIAREIGRRVLDGENGYTVRLAAKLEAQRKAAAVEAALVRRTVDLAEAIGYPGHVRGKSVDVRPPTGPLLDFKIEADAYNHRSMKARGAVKFSLVVDPERAVELAALLEEFQNPRPLPYLTQQLADAQAVTE